MKNPKSATKKALVVEDEPSITEVCQRVLSGEGFEVDVAANGKVAQDMINRKLYDLCLIDIRIPAMNGKELYQWLKQEKPELIKGVIFTTGDAMGGDTQAFLDQVGRPLLPKPFTTDELMAMIREVLKRVE